MTIRALVFDIGGVLEIAADGRDPTFEFQAMVSAWEVDSRFRLVPWASCSSGFEDGVLGHRTEQEWHRELQREMDDVTLDLFVRDFWNLYLGVLNGELASYFSQLRPRYKTALLSNSFVGAREQEEARYALDTLTDFIVYSHEVGLAKPDRRIYELTCARLHLRPDEIIFLDDVEAYVRGAHDIGMHAILFKNNDQALAAIEERLARGSG